MDKKNRGSVFMAFDNIAEKEMSMYLAVIDMVKEDYDINSIKVSDITGRAGIGKGTAYEYFSCKEEIIVKALLYDTYTHLKKIEGVLKENRGYREKFFLLMDYLEENLPHSKGAASLLKMFSGTFEIRDDIRKELEKIHESAMCPVAYIESMIDEFMLQGLEENIYSQENPILQRSVFVTQVTGYVYCIMNQYYGGQLPKDEAREFAYSSIVKLLNP